MPRNTVTASIADIDLMTTLEGVSDMQQEDALFSTSAAVQRSIRDRVGISLKVASVSDAINRIQEAEQAGVRQVWEQTAGAADILTAFAVVGTQTRHIRLGTSIVPVYPRHPFVIAQQVQAINEVAPGRLRLGIGPGNCTLIEDWYGLEQNAPLPYLKEYLEVVRSILWEGKADYRGKFFHVNREHLLDEWMTSSLRKVQVPLLISALGPKAFRLAGEISDGAISWLCPFPYLLNVALPELRAGAEARQRPIPPIIAHINVILSTDEAAVRARMRQTIQRTKQNANFARVFVQAGFASALDGSEQEQDALVRTLYISGDEATVRNRIQELLASGLDELLLTLAPIADEEQERQQLLQLVGSLQDS